MADQGSITDLEESTSVPGINARSLAAPFLVKTYQMVDDPSTDDIISWNDDGSGFTVRSAEKLASDLLPAYFKHNKFSRFVRRLNTYGFRKMVPDRWEFSNEYFRRDQKELLSRIRRRKKILRSKVKEDIKDDMVKAKIVDCMVKEMETMSESKVQSDSHRSPAQRAVNDWKGLDLVAGQNISRENPPSPIKRHSLGVFEDTRSKQPSHLTEPSSINLDLQLRPYSYSSSHDTKHWSSSYLPLLSRQNSIPSYFPQFSRKSSFSDTTFGIGSTSFLQEGLFDATTVKQSPYFADIGSSSHTDTENVRIMQWKRLARKVIVINRFSKWAREWHCESSDEALIQRGIKRAREISYQSSDEAWPLRGLEAAHEEKNQGSNKKLKFMEITPASLTLRHKAANMREEESSDSSLATLSLNDIDHGSEQKILNKKQKHTSSPSFYQNSAAMEEQQLPYTDEELAFDEVERGMFELEVFSISDDQYHTETENLDIVEMDQLQEKLRRCIRFCSMFPHHYKFEKDAMIQLWVAEGFFEAEREEHSEVLASFHFDYMVKQNMILSSSSDNSYHVLKYTMNNDMLKNLKHAKLGDKFYSWPEGDYLKVQEAQLGSTSELTRHLSLLYDKLDPSSFKVLKGFKDLRTLMLFPDSVFFTGHLPRDLFVSLKHLETLDLHQTHILELPGSIGNLTRLCFLDISGTPIRSLPETIDSLARLRTLKLKNCFHILRLPKKMKNLTHLRHLDLDIIRQLKSMPPGMGNLTNLQTLAAFLAGIEDGQKVGELKDLNNLRGSFCLARLENVSNQAEAREASMNNKQYLDKLELRWGDRPDVESILEGTILECLQPHSNIKELSIVFYNGTTLPTWLGNSSLPNLTNLTLYKCRYCDSPLPSLGELPSLKILNIVELSGVKDFKELFRGDETSKVTSAFPKLEKLTLDEMLNLENWTGIENGDFACLLELTISDCPKLAVLPSFCSFQSLVSFEISSCARLVSLPEQFPPTLKSLIITGDCPNIKEKCRKPEGQDWSKIAHMPSILIDHEEVASHAND